MTNPLDGHDAGYAGPVLRSGEVADAVVEAVREDNAEREVIIEEHASYIRVKVAGECIVRRETVERMLGRPFEMREIEINMPAFAGHIRTSTDAFRFVIGKRG
ncbi:MAG: MmoB/DmpM family protein [Deltaproteobacteria bacterium]|nr:MmoB/DmpM family protein [Deltaproteobacteria bacterium]